MARRLFINPVPCTGCLNCMAVCSQNRSGGQDPSEVAIRVLLDPFGGRHGHIWCRHCAEPACAAACPAGAIGRDASTGAVVTDESLCVGCGACVDACPYGAVAWQASRSLPVRCDLCGGEPRCAAACAFGVIRFLEEGDPSSSFEGMPDCEQDVNLGRGPR